MSRTEGDQPVDLGRLRQRLEEYRRGGSRGKALPGWVWAAAGRLARRHGVHRCARALGLEYNKLKRASGARAAASADGWRGAAGAYYSDRSRSVNGGVVLVRLFAPRFTEKL